MCEHKRVLFVDDDAIILRVMRRSLGDVYDVFVANSGHAAIEILANEGPFDCLVSDMRMPQMDGVELVNRVEKGHPGLPCIILTGNQDEESELRAKNDCNAFRLLNKPCPRDEIIESIEEAIRNAKDSYPTPKERSRQFTSV